MKDEHLCVPCPCGHEACIMQMRCAKCSSGPLYRTQTNRKIERVVNEVLQKVHAAIALGLPHDYFATPRETLDALGVPFDPKYERVGRTPTL